MFGSDRSGSIARIVLAAAILGAAGCQGAATPTSPLFTTDLLAGNVVTLVPSFHTVTTGVTSVLSLSLAELTPNTGVAVGVGFGIPDGQGGCSLLAAQTLKVGNSFTISSTTAAQAGNPGTRCVAVFEYSPTGDNGANAIPTPLAYLVKFNHH